MAEDAKIIKNPVKAIRKFCVDCMGSPYETINCTAAPGTRTPCPLYPFRQGKNPFRARRNLTEAQKAKNAENLAKARKEIS